MHKDKAEHLNFFRTEVNNLYSEIKQWISETNLRYEESTIRLNEKNCDEYEINKLTLITEENATPIEIEPIGAWVIGANGRIDIKGQWDRIIIVHLNKGGPFGNIALNNDDGNPLDAKKRPFFKEINEAGWYWFEHKLSSKGHKLTSELFFDILADVSGYERK